MQGGSGNFQWITSNTSVATVNKKGLVATKNIVGKTEVKVSDYKNPSFSDAGSITVLPPEELNFVSSCLLYTSPSPRDATLSRMPSSA